MNVERIREQEVDGVLHHPVGAGKAGVVLAHGAGSNFDAPVLRRAAEQLAGDGFFVLRFNLAFRQKRPSGPPHPSVAEADRLSIAQAVDYLQRTTSTKHIVTGGHSYGGRQATMAAAENPALVSSLLLFSYPLHPPEKPEQLRTEHFPRLRTPCLFLHGEKDPFGTPQEMQNAVQLIPAPVRLEIISGAGHDLRKPFDLRGKLIL